MIAIGVHDLKYGGNFASIARLCSCYGVSSLIIKGVRYKHSKQDTTKFYKHNSIINVDDLIESKPVGLIPVAVEITDDAECLANYRHYENSYYILGNESSGIPHEVIKKCKDVIRIPTKHCLNVAMAASVVMYDRILKGKIYGHKKSP